jgi:hypothetical protein
MGLQRLRLMEKQVNYSSLHKDTTQRYLSIDRLRHSRFYVSLSHTLSHILSYTLSRPCCHSPLYTQIRCYIPNLSANRYILPYSLNESRHLAGGYDLFPRLSFGQYVQTRAFAHRLRQLQVFHTWYHR